MLRRRSLSLALATASRALGIIVVVASIPLVIVAFVFIGGWGVAQRLASLLCAKASVVVLLTKEDRLAVRDMFMFDLVDTSPQAVLGGCIIANIAKDYRPGLTILPKLVNQDLRQFVLRSAYHAASFYPEFVYSRNEGISLYQKTETTRTRWSAQLQPCIFYSCRLVSGHGIKSPSEPLGTFLRHSCTWGPLCGIPPWAR